MAWVVLVVSGALEAVWATAMAESDGFSKLRPTLIFLVGVVLSMGGLAYALRFIPVGTGYAVWVGIGAIVTAAWAMARGAEAATPMKLVFLAGIIGCVIGLQLVSSGESH